VGETAKSLPACKAALSWAVGANFVLIARDREPQEVSGNTHPRYMIIRRVIFDRIRLILYKNPLRGCFCVCYNLVISKGLGNFIVMEQNIFSPRISQPFKDSLGSLLKNLALGLVTVSLVLLPVFFIPGVFTSLGFTKVYMVGLILLISFILLSLSVLRSGTARVMVPATLAFFWLFALIAVASSLLSSDVRDSLFGNAFEVHTAGFIVLMALLMTAGMFFAGQKSMVTKLFLGLGATTILLQLYHVARLFLGSEFLSLGLFNSATVSPIGSFNDLAIFSGLVVLVVLVLVREITSTKIGKIIAVSLTTSSLVLLSVINFYAVWLVIGFFGLMMLLYLVSRDTWLRGGESVDVPVTRTALSLVGVVCIVAAVFVVSGDSVGAMISRVTGISYLEIRPSVSTTIDISKSALGENALFGIGPNRFEDAWREYKDPIINQTIFWGTIFTAGSGFVPTLAITTGIAGAIAIVLFFGAFAFLAYRLFIRSDFKDSGWRSIGVLAFISATYLWLMSVLYVPGVTVLLFAAFATGLVLATYATIKTEGGLVVDVTKNRQYGFLLIATVLVVIITSILSAITVSKQYWSGVIYANTVSAFQNGSDYSSVDNGLTRAFDLYPQDSFMAERAQLRYIELQKLTQEEATALTQQQYGTYLSEGISLSEQAINLDPTNPANYMVLGGFYALLNPDEFEGVKEQVGNLFSRVRELDPINPYYYVAEAQYQSQNGDLESARKSLLKAIEIKNNYTDALLLLSQLDIQEGKVADAIAVTSAVVSIEPNNPTRYFQLGVLLAANKDYSAASQAFERAIAIDTNYANARYFLALTYLDQDKKNEALEQLKKVRETNSDNATVVELIRQVESGEYVKPGDTPEVTVNEPNSVSQEGDVTTTTDVPETDVVSPVNQVSQVEETESAAQ
jgi:tetratricopeptide (TPR) repeat protein